jgi:hypothetical protein
VNLKSRPHRVSVFRHPAAEDLDTAAVEVALADAATIAVRHARGLAIIFHLCQGFAPMLQNPASIRP